MRVCVCKIPVLITTAAPPPLTPPCLSQKKGEQIVPFCVSVAAGRRYSAITSRNIEKKQANPKWQAERLQEKTRRDGGKGGRRRRWRWGWKMKKKELSAKIEVRRHNHTSLGWREGKLEEKEGYRERKGAKSGGGKVENVTYWKFLGVTFQG